MVTHNHQKRPGKAEKRDYELANALRPHVRPSWSIVNLNDVFRYVCVSLTDTA